MNIMIPFFCLYISKAGYKPTLQVDSLNRISYTDW